MWRLNAQRLGLSPVGIEAVVLSHWHMDHSGGLPEVAAMIAESRSRLAQEGAAASLPPPAVFDVHPHRPACRGAMLPSGQPVPFNQDPGLEELAVSRSCFRVWGVTGCVWFRWILCTCAMPRSAASLAPHDILCRQVPFDRWRVLPGWSRMPSRTPSVAASLCLGRSRATLPTRQATPTTPPCG